MHENSLAKAISRLRQALGRDGELLETVHGYGYRLAAEPAEIAPPPQSQPAQAARPGPALVFSFLTPLSLGAAGVAVHSAATRTTDDPGIIKGEAADSIGRVLWVDDHPQNNIAERGYLESQKVAVYQVTTTDEALHLLAMYKYGAVISDINRNDKPLDGITLVKAMRQRHDRTPFILYTVVPSQAQRTLLAQAGGQAATVTREQLYAAVLPRIRARWAARYKHD